MVSVEIKGHQFLKRQNHMAEEGVGKAARQRLPGAIHHEHNVRHPGQSRVAPLGEGYDLVPVLSGMAYIVQHRPCFAALTDGEHHRGGFRAIRQMMGMAEEHIIVEMHIVEYHEAADGQPLRDIGAHDIGEALAGGKQLRLTGVIQQFAEPGNQFVGVVVDETFEAFRAAFLSVEVKLAAEIVVQLAVPVKAQSLAHFDNSSGGEIILVGNLLDADPLFPPLNMCGDAGDYFFSSSESKFVNRK